MKGYGIEPRIIGNFDLDVNEMMYYMYMPISMKNERRIVVPQRTQVFEPLVRAAMDNMGEGQSESKYIYMTAKHVFVTPENMANRPEWHCDGFMTNDVNYVWQNVCPTEFALQPIDMIQDDVESMQQMERELKDAKIVTYGDKRLLRLDQYNVHRVPKSSYKGMRTFVKITFSDSIFNLKGNSHNYDLDYNWEMYERGELRNMESVNST